MSGNESSQVLAIVVCGAGPAVEIATFVKLAIDRGWTVQVIATAAALEFFDQAAIEALTGTSVRSQYPAPGSSRSRVPDAIAVAPATYNTINKWALGISDTYALGVLAGPTSLSVPIVVLPSVDPALASRAPFQQSVKSLRAEGVSILLGPGGIEPHQPNDAKSLIASYPWHLALDELDGMVGTADDDTDADA